MTKNLTNKEILEIEQQLACPNGDVGIDMGNTMHKTNITMTRATIKLLEIQHRNSILELGHGNCGHLNELLNTAEAINYYGLEISKTMYEVAKKENNSPQAKFKLYDGTEIPFKDSSFDRTMSVNTIYFWSNPEKTINEIERTLKINGICVLTYANKEFMKHLPFVGEKFKLYDKNDIQNLIKKTALKIIEFKSITEQVKSKTGDNLERTFTLLKLKKNNH